MTDFDLDRLIRDTLARSKEPDPHVIARRLVPKIPGEAVHEVLARCLIDRVREAIRFQRMDVHSAPPVTVPKTGRSRWQGASWLLQRYCVAGEWKLLRDCTAADCDLIAADYARREAEQAALKDRFRRLAQQLRDAGVGTLGDLDESDLDVAA